jgi:hypothetical protein
MDGGVKQLCVASGVCSVFCVLYKCIDPENVTLKTPASVRQPHNYCGPIIYYYESYLSGG